MVFPEPPNNVSFKRTKSSRQQTMLLSTQVKQSSSPSHSLLGKKKKIKTTSGKPGAPALKERLASKVSLYAEKRGLGSATEK